MVHVTEVITLIEGKWSLLQKVASLLEGEWLCYRGGQF